MKNVLVCLFALLFAFGCKDAEAIKDLKVMSSDMEAVAVSEPKIANMEMPTEAKPTETQIIRTSNLRFETNDLNKSYQNIQKAILKHKGTLQNDESGKDYASAFRNLTIRKIGRAHV